LWKAERRAEALAEAEAALAADPQDRALILRRCAFLSQLGRAEEALAVLLPLHRADPRHPAVTLELAQAYRATGEVAIALALLDQILVADPAWRRAWLAKVDLLTKAGRPDEALAAVEAALPRMQADRPLRLRQAVLLSALRRPGEAIPVLRALHDEGPDDLAVLLGLGHAHIALGETAEGRAMFDAVLAADPVHGGAWRAKLADAIARHDQEALMDVARHLHARLRDAADPQAAAQLARIPPLLEIARWSAEVAAWIDAVAAQPARTKPNDLWALHGIARLHGLSATGRRLMEGLLARPVLPLTVALRMLPDGNAAPGDRAALQAQLRGRLQESEVPVFDLHGAAMELGPARAVAGRLRRSARPAGEIILLADLLLEAGREALALRYLGFARRFRPADALLRRRHIKALTAAGQVEAAEREVELLLAESSSPSDRQAGIAALIALGQGTRALELMDASSDPVQHRALRRSRLELMLRFGRLDEARVLAAELATLAHASRAAHFGLTLEGMQLSELRLAELHGGPPHPTSIEGWLITPSMQALDAHMARCAARPPQRRDHPGRIPRHILQYWDSGTPPPALDDIMRSWRAAGGYAYHLFDRRAALRFLAEELGEEWAAALRLAHHAAEQSDFFRLCFLAVKGGIYADCDDRLIGPLDGLVAGETGLVVFRERRGTIANNLLLAEPANPVVVHAAVAAKRALLRRDRDSVWAKTGPGLLTRAVAMAVAEASAQQAEPAVTIHTMLDAARHVQCHIPLPYKRGNAYWNSGGRGTHLRQRMAPQVTG
jgi:predicted Zn-dependent protease